MSVYSCAPLLFAKSPKTLLGFFFLSFSVSFLSKNAYFRNTGWLAPFFGVGTTKGACCAHSRKV